MVSLLSVCFVLMALMKHIKTILLRLLINQEQPETLRGSIQIVTSEEVFLFDGEIDLFKILQTIQIESIKQSKSSPDEKNNMDG